LALKLDAYCFKNLKKIYTHLSLKSIWNLIGLQYSNAKRSGFQEEPKIISQAADKLITKKDDAEALGLK
jgi:hypothetical protein